MRNKTKKSRRYYAAQRPRGFANEVKVYSFSSADRRNRWVDEHEHDGGVNSAACGARRATATEARRICRYSGNASTRSYNSGEPVFIA